MSIVKYSPSMGKDYSNDRKIWAGHRSLVVGHDECTATVGVILKLSVLF